MPYFFCADSLCLFHLIAAKSKDDHDHDTTGKPAPQPGSQLVTKKRAKLLVLAVVLFLLTFYTNTNTNRYEGLAFEYNATKPLPPGSYALCSGEGGARAVYAVDATDGVVECVLVVDEWVKGTGSLGSVEGYCNLYIGIDGLMTIKESVEAVSHYVHSNPDILADEGGIVEGWGWDYEAFEGGKMPTAVRITLSNIYPFPSILFVLALTNSHNRLPTRTTSSPTANALLSSQDKHATWFSQTILDANGPYPTEVDGVLSCGMRRGVMQAYSSTAMTLIKPPTITPQVHHKRFTNTVRLVLVLVVVFVFGVGLGSRIPTLQFPSLRLAEGPHRQSKREGGLPLRIYTLSPSTFPPSTLVPLAPLPPPPRSDDAYWGSTRQKADDMDGISRLSVRSVKIFADGALKDCGCRCEFFLFLILVVIMFLRWFFRVCGVAGGVLCDGSVVVAAVVWFFGWRVGVSGPSSSRPRPTSL
ncbi:hypothetical protein FA15DRAFT_708289 [Coprinopsis marcescibilis]|uniref:Uncharacterized protein n=1 Tax=Coprinopsis marcescibilis TaxID=230819 RepID=A0A5C3KJ94_COPMA|nr:hypothetical protein FA15DRAFT_708289 [Coprinopsis marcescibilis]